MNLGLTTVLAVGQNIWFHDLFKQLPLNFSIQEEKHTYCIKCGPKSWKHLFPVAEEKKEPKGLGAFGKQSQPLTGGWVFFAPSVASVNVTRLRFLQNLRDS